MPLPAAAARNPIHNRNVAFRGFQRDDGLWDIEAQMRDTKEQEFVIPNEGTWAPGQPMHDLSIRVTIDNRLVVHEIHASMDSVPHPECPTARASMQTMVGACMARGWRKSIETNLGGIAGCSHLRELLFNMATVAFQTLPEDAYPDQGEQPPFFLGKCKAWDYNGTTVQRLFPMYFQRPPVKVKAPQDL